MKNTYNPPSQEILCCNKEKIECTEEQKNAKMIQETLCGFDAIVEVENVIVGNLITRYYIKPKGDTTVKEIKSLVQELQYVLGVENIKLSVIGEKQVIALDIPNRNPTKLKIQSISLTKWSLNEFGFHEWQISLQVLFANEQAMIDTLNFLNWSDKYKLFVHEFTYPMSSSMQQAFSVTLPIKVLYK